MSWMMSLVRYACATVAALLIATPCAAQALIGRDSPQKGSIEVSGGGAYHGGNDLSTQPATLTRNPPTGSGALELFRADTSVASAFGAQARLGYYLTPAMAIEGGVQVARPKLESRLSDDFESASATVATGSINSYLFTGSFLYHFGTGGKLRPFLVGGAGHVRDVHDGNNVVESGLEYHAGGGFKSWFGAGRGRFGLRADVLLSIRDGGVGTEDDRRMVPSAAFSLAYVFGPSRRAPTPPRR